MLMEHVKSMVANLVMTIIGVNAAEMLRVTRARRVFAVIEDGKVININISRVDQYGFVKIPKNHGLIEWFLSGEIMPVLIIGAQELSVEQKVDTVKMYNSRLLNVWKRKVMDGKISPDSTPEICILHPTAIRQPVTLAYLAEPETFAKVSGMDLYKDIEKVPKAFAPLSTPKGAILRMRGREHIKMLAIDESILISVFGDDSLEVLDGSFFFKDAKQTVIPYTPEIAKLLGFSGKKEEFFNLDFQARPRGPVIKNGKMARIGGKGKCEFSTEKFLAIAKALNIDERLVYKCDCFMRSDNIKTRNVTTGDIIKIKVSNFDIVKWASVDDSSSSTFGTQGVVIGSMPEAEALHQEYSKTDVYLEDGTVKNRSYAAILRDGLFYQRSWAIFRILAGSVKEMTMEDFKRKVLEVCCFSLIDNNGVKPIYTYPLIDSWWNQMLPRFVRFYRTQVVRVRTSGFSLYAANGTLLPKSEGKKSFVTDLDKMRRFHNNEIYPFRPTRKLVDWMLANNKHFFNYKKDPATSIFCFRGCWFIHKDEKGNRVFEKDLFKVNIETLEYSRSCNSIEICTPEQEGVDFDGDLLSSLPSETVHFGAHKLLFVDKPEGGDKVKFNRPTTFEEWETYVEFINSIYDSYSLSAMNTGLLDLETRLQCCKAIIDGNIAPTKKFPFRYRHQRQFTYIREEMGIKVSKWGSTTGSIDPMEYLRRLTYGEISPKEWPAIFRATHKFGGVGVASRGGESANRKILSAIFGAIARIETLDEHGNVKIQFFLNYMFKIMRKAMVNGKLNIPFPKAEHSKRLANEFQVVWSKHKDSLCKGTIFTPTTVEIFIGQNHKQGLRGLHSDLSNMALNSDDKREQFRLFNFGLRFILSFFPYYRGIEINKICKLMAVKSYKRFELVKDLIMKDEKDLTLEERTKLEDCGWLDIMVVKPVEEESEEEEEEEIVFQKGFFSDIKEARTLIGWIDPASKLKGWKGVASWLPAFHKLDTVERVKQVDKWMEACVIYSASVGFGNVFSQKLERTVGLSSALTFLFPEEAIIKAAIKRYEHLGVPFPFQSQMTEVLEKFEELSQGTPDEEDTVEED